VALQLELEWTLTACGLVALADGVLKGGEASRVLDMVHEALPPEERDEWIDLISDRQRLLAHAARLAAPPADTHERLLRRAWSIALVDGEGSSDEARVLEQIGERFGIERGQVITWRKLWTSEAIESAGHIATFAALLLHRRGVAAPTPQKQLAPPDRENFLQMLARMPLSEARRLRLHRLMDESPTVEELGNALLWLEPERRHEVLRELATHIRTGGHGPLGRQLFLALAARMAVSDDAARAYLDPA
jgi:tellurite resistance protein